MVSFLRKFVLPLSAVAFVTAAAPAILTTPFISQTDAHVGWAYRLDALGVPLASVSLLVAIFAIVVSWRVSVGRLSRVVQAFAVVLAGSALWASNANVAELAFRPLTESTYLQLSEVDYMEATDLVLGIELHDQPFIYPVSIVGYHHILNERMSGESFVVTY